MGPYHLYFNRTLFSHGNFTETALQRQAGYSTPQSTDYVRPENQRAARAAARRLPQHDHGRRRTHGRGLALGTPEEVTRRIIAQADAAGADTVQISLNRGAMPHEMFIEQIRRFARGRAAGPARRIGSSACRRLRKIAA